MCNPWSQWHTTRDKKRTKTHAGYRDEPFSIQGVHSMSAETLARLQFGTTIVYHYLFVPLTLGLVLLIAIMETFYVRSGNTVYKRMAQFWGKLFIINFALGVITGIVQEFQFGMNWSSYSRFIGDVIGASLALETLLAFFLESTFLGV